MAPEIWIVISTYCKVLKIIAISQDAFVWSEKNYFEPLGVPCLKRPLRIRAQLELQQAKVNRPSCNRQGEQAKINPH